LALTAAALMAHWIASILSLPHWIDWGYRIRNAGKSGTTASRLPVIY
jgi:hypothetical protein